MRSGWLLDENCDEGWFVVANMWETMWPPWASKTCTTKDYNN